MKGFDLPPEGTFVTEPITGYQITSVPSTNCLHCEFDKNHEAACTAMKCHPDCRTGRKPSIVVEKNRYLTLKLTGELDDLRL